MAAATDKTRTASAGRNVSWSTDPFVLNVVAARPASVPGLSAPPEPETVPRPADMQGRGALLRSTREVMGYYLEAMDGQIGHVEDFVIDTAPWHLRYLVVDTRNWWPGKKVLVAPTWVRQVQWDTQQVTVELSRDAIKNSPEFDPTAPLERAYEACLYEHYDRAPYWH